MQSPKQMRHWQRVTVAIALALLLYDFLVYRPLSQTVRQLDKPLADLRQKLAGRNLPTRGGSLDLPDIEQQWRQAHASLNGLRKIGRAIDARVALDPAVRIKLREPFQLIDYQNERQHRIEELTGLARQHQVTLEPAVRTAFPELTEETREPARLWAQLHILYHLLATAVNCQVSTVKSASVAPLELHRAPAGVEPLADEIPARIEVVGAMPAVSRFLSSLLLRRDEIKARALPESLPAKPALFVDQIVLRKFSPDKPDDVHLELRLCGFVSHN